MPELKLVKKIWIKATMEILEISQAETATQIHLSKGQVCKIINGEQDNPVFNQWLMNQIANKMFGMGL